MKSALWKDVYKRQFQHGEGFLFLLPCVQRVDAIQRRFNRPCLFGEGNRLFEKLGGDMPVSYTHLDVYKRQGGDRARAGRILLSSGHLYGDGPGQRRRRDRGSDL